MGLLRRLHFSRLIISQYKLLNHEASYIILRYLLLITRPIDVGVYLMELRP